MLNEFKENEFREITIYLAKTLDQHLNQLQSLFFQNSQR